MAMTGALAVVAIAGIAVAALGTLYAARAQAQGAADAAALAAAVATYPPATSADPLMAARGIAEDNGAMLVGCTCPRDDTMKARIVEVVTGVRVDLPLFGDVTVRSSARAEFDPRLWLGR